MIEIIYNESGETGSSVVVKPPKNIRQIGSPKGRHKIYMEDYVYTFLHSAAFEGGCQRRWAVLLGKSEVSQEIRYTFISGAVSCGDLIFKEETIEFDETCWEYIYKEIKEYFDNQEVVGWFLEITGFPLALSPVIEAVHRKYFIGRDKVLLLSEFTEGEDTFYAYDQGTLQKKEGYYIYYEKNLAMQEYMVSTRERVRKKEGGIEVPKVAEQELESPKYAEFTEKSETKAEQAILNYRQMLQQRKGEKPQNKVSMLLYTAASTAMILLCVIGITTLDNYEKMKQVEAALSTITRPQVESEESQISDQPQELVVESIPGEITPQVEQEQTPTATGDGQAPAATEEGQTPVSSEEGQTPSATEEGQTAASSEEGQIPAETEDGQAPIAPEDGQASAALEETTPAQAALDQGYYVVQPGDRLENICKSLYNTTAIMEQLCKINEITDIDKIYAGQKLILP